MLVGLVGNCLSFVVMKSKALRNKSYSHYLWSVVYIQPVVVLFIAVSVGRSVRLASRFAVLSLQRCCIVSVCWTWFYAAEPLFEDYSVCIILGEKITSAEFLDSGRYVR